MKYLVIGFTAIFLALCSKDVGPEKVVMDYMIFGSYYGHCLGEGCVKIYKLTETALYENTSQSFVRTEFNFVPGKDGDLEKAENLIHLIPDQLLESTESFFGCPDCWDQGGLYLEVSNKGTIRSWRIDTDKHKVPGYLHDFMAQVNLVIDELDQ